MIFFVMKGYGDKGKLFFEIKECPRLPLNASICLLNHDLSDFTFVLLKSW